MKSCTCFIITSVSEPSKDPNLIFYSQASTSFREVVSLGQIWICEHAYMNVGGACVPHNWHPSLLGLKVPQDKDNPLGRSQSLPCWTERPLRRDAAHPPPYNPPFTADWIPPSVFLPPTHPSSKPRTLLQRGAQTVWKRGHLITGRVETQTQEMHFFASVYLAK